MDNFSGHYVKIYGKRWTALRESLLLPAITVPYSYSLIEPYYLDHASILAAKCLKLPKAADKLSDKEIITDNSPVILDACAAPGGKTLVIASQMDPGIKLLANEYSRERRRRLSLVLEKHLPLEKINQVSVTGFDAAAAAGRKSEQNRFAAILLDVPCSSERHVLQNASALNKWTPARPRYLAQRQWALLSAAFLLLAPGGSLVYSTCSINPAENDSVAERLIKKYGEQSGTENYCIIDKPGFSEGEETKYGRIILPDMSEGAGPLYVARFKKYLP